MTKFDMSTTGFEFHNDFELPTQRNVTSSTDLGFENTIPGIKIDDNHGLQPQTLKVIKSFVLKSPSMLSLNWSVIETTRNPEMPAYYAVVYPLNFTQPDVVLHAGPDKTGTVLGVARFRFSRHILLGFGDPEHDANNVVWEQMKNISWWFWNLKYQLNLEIRPDDRTDFAFEPRRRHPGTKRQFTWEQTRNAEDGVDGWLRKIEIRNFKLVDAENGKVVAIFLTKHLRSLTELGELRIYQEVEKELEIAIILSCASINQMINKKHG